jgi:hypothetical protein
MHAGDRHAFANISCEAPPRERVDSFLNVLRSRPTLTDLLDGIQVAAPAPNDRRR